MINDLKNKDFELSRIIKTMWQDNLDSKVKIIQLEKAVKDLQKSQQMRELLNES